MDLPLRVKLGCLGMTRMHRELMPRLQRDNGALSSVDDVLDVVNSIGEVVCATT